MIWDLLIAVAVLLATSAAILAYALFRSRPRKHDRLSDSAGEAHFAAQAQEEARRRA